MTAKQKQLMAFIKAKLAETGICPSMPQKGRKPIKGPARPRKVKQPPHVICDAPDSATPPPCNPRHQDSPEAVHNGKAAWREKRGPDHACPALVDEILGEWF